MRLTVQEQAMPERAEGQEVQRDMGLLVRYGKVPVNAEH
jgi:hypothetical protein